MDTTRPRAIRSPAPRFPLALVLALALLSWAFGLTVPARAQQPLDPVKRVTFSIHQIQVHNDRDWGKGEIRITLRVWQVNEGCPPDSTDGGCITQLLKTGNMDFLADDGDTKLLNVAFPSGPQAGDELADGVTSRYGIPMYPGRVYGWEIKGVEVDPVVDDRLGSVRGIMTAENDWGIGLRTERSVNPGHFSARYSIQAISRLPNVKPTAIVRKDIPISTDAFICATMTNNGSDVAAPFLVTFRADGADVPNGSTRTGGMNVGQTGDLCIAADPKTADQKRWSVTLDEPRVVVETDEYDNVFEQPLLGTVVTDIGWSTDLQTEPPVYRPVPVASPAPAPKNSSAPASGQASDQADLTVGTIKVRGQTPDGKDDCKDGKNPVSIVVKNAGAAKSGPFAVGLTVDGGEAIEESVDGLEAGKEREIRFDEVRLKKGERKLVVTVDQQNTVAESNDENNGRTVTATCRDDA